MESADESTELWWHHRAQYFTYMIDLKHFLNKSVVVTINLKVVNKK